LWLAVAAAGDVQAQPARPEGAADAPLTVVVTRYVRPGCEARFEALLHDTFQDGDPVAGRLRAEFLRPAEPDSHAYTVIYRFDRLSEYAEWLKSPERTVWLDRSAPLIDGPPQFQYRTGLEVWVTPPDETGYRAPEPIKTMAVNWLSITPVTVVLTAALAPFTASWPSVAAIGVREAIMVSAVGYVIMPYMSRLFRDWLFPAITDCRAG
jgi:antibiotic biosynthesis monooxygenase (ABM) superfamily enzyme